MARSNLRFSEKELSDLFVKGLKKSEFLIMQELIIRPAELDIVLFNKETLILTNIEIKKNNWKKLFEQTRRGKLYCHFSIALMPISMKRNVDINSFTQEGLGLMFYTENKKGIEIIRAIDPSYSSELNRNFKKIIYNQFYLEYGTLIYA